MTANPSEAYQSRLVERRASEALLSRKDERLSFVRLVVFGLGAGLLLLWWRGGIDGWWLALPLAAFAVLVRLHDRVIGARDAAARAASYYERGLARIDDRWAGEGETGERFGDDHHPFAADLDLFGDGSLFQLLSVARTRAGEEHLAAWLKHPASPAEVAGRQAAVTELADLLDLRERVALAGTAVGAAVHSEALTAWAEDRPRLRDGWLRGMAALLTTATIAGAGVAFVSERYEWLTAALLADVLFFLPLRSPVQRALHGAGGPARDLDVLAHVLGHLERASFRAPLLVALRRRLDTNGVPASAAIGRLHRLVELHDWQHNLFFAPIAAALLWGTHLAFAIERWRAVHGSEVRAWLNSVGEFEALASLAAFRYEHPGDVWPEMVGGDALFQAAELGHPLIAGARLVRNDVRLGGDTRLWLVSGSNMSGKSTLLRTVGITVVLAQAGAPVRAASLRLSPLAIGATLRIQDSLQEGRSRFYAEITRLREITDAARGPMPVLFLFDELFHGTNSHDRLAGASGVLRSLIERGAIGFVTTHDLALTTVTDALSPRAANVHFEDRFHGGEMTFDYRVKPGPVTRSNAIALMRAVGLDVEEG